MKKLVSLFCLLLSLNVTAHDGHDHAKINLAISVAFNDKGELLRTYVKDGFVLMDTSSDMAKTFSPAVKINSTIQKIGADGEARPKIALAENGYVYITYTEALVKPFTGYIWFARSIDGGKSFEPAYIVHQDRAETTHRFDSLNVSPNGNITVAWVDKRDLLAAKAAGKAYDGAAIYYAVSTDLGKSFAREKKLADSSCECCRIALVNKEVANKGVANKESVNKANSTVVALWRHVFANSERDHAIAELSANDTVPVVHRATFGHWKIDDCPHQGAALAVGEGFGYHMAWFDGGNDETGKNATLYVARMDGDAWVSSVPKKFGNNAHQAAHPALLSQDENVWLAWREVNPDTKMTEIFGKTSTDGGRNWENTQQLFSTAGAADYPILLMNKEANPSAKLEKPYLIVNTAIDGLKLVPLM